MKRKDKIIEGLGLQAHPEGGFFRETYRDSRRVYLDASASITRAASTAIYYLLGAHDFSALHRIASDEVWHFYEGSPLRVSILSPEDGGVEHLVLGSSASAGQVYQAVVPAGCWFGATLDPDSPFDADAYALVGCTVSPGFEFEDFELATSNDLLARFPEHVALINSLTRR